MSHTQIANDNQKCNEEIENYVDSIKKSSSDEHKIDLKNCNDRISISEVILTDNDLDVNCKVRLLLTIIKMANSNMSSRGGRKSTSKKTKRRKSTKKRRPTK
jgi:hypothetical protein